MTDSAAVLSPAVEDTDSGKKTRKKRATKKQAAKEAVTSDRPLLIDEADGPCELCAQHNDGICDNCGAKIKRGEDWAHDRGYQSVKPSHIHIVVLTPENGPPVQGREGKFAELCYKCHRADRKAAYKNHEHAYGEAPA